MYRKKMLWSRVWCKLNKFSAEVSIRANLWADLFGKHIAPLHAYIVGASAGSLGALAVQHARTVDFLRIRYSGKCGLHLAGETRMTIRHT